MPQPYSNYHILWHGRQSNRGLQLPTHATQEVFIISSFDKLTWIHYNQLHLSLRTYIPLVRNFALTAVNTQAERAMSCTQSLKNFPNLVLNMLCSLILSYSDETNPRCAAECQGNPKRSGEGPPTLHQPFRQHSRTVVMRRRKTKSGRQACTTLPDQRLVTGVSQGPSDREPWIIRRWVIIKRYPMELRKPDLCLTAYQRDFCAVLSGLKPCHPTECTIGCRTNKSISGRRDG